MTGYRLSDMWYARWRGNVYLARHDKLYERVAAVAQMEYVCYRALEIAKQNQGGRHE